MSKFIIAFIPLLLIMEVIAVDFTSSNSSFYPCNAGLAHRAEKTCFSDGTIVDSCNELDTCSCISPSKGDDFFSASSRDWSSSLEDNYNLNSGRFEDLCKNQTNCSDKNYLGKIGTRGFSNLSKKPGKKIINELSFILGSDLLGADYFVDICFKREKNDDEAYRITTQAQPLQQASSYISATSLVTKYIIQCKNGQKNSWEFNKTPNAVSYQINPSSKFCIIRFNFSERSDGRLRANHLMNAPFSLKVEVQ